jgi:hypothetical protein
VLTKYLSIITPYIKLLRESSKKKVFQWKWFFSMENLALQLTTLTINFIHCCKKRAETTTTTHLLQRIYFDPNINILRDRKRHKSHSRYKHKKRKNKTVSNAYFTLAAVADSNKFIAIVWSMQSVDFQLVTSSSSLMCIRFSSSSLLLQSRTNLTHKSLSLDGVLPIIYYILPPIILF